MLKHVEGGACGWGLQFRALEIQLQFGEAQQTALERFEYAGQVALSRFVRVVTRHYNMSQILLCINPKMHWNFWGTDGMHYYNFNCTALPMLELDGDYHPGSLLPST